MKNQYNKTIAACFTGYIVQAIVNNFTPLLFLFFQRSYQIPLSQITLLVTFNFGIQLLVDLYRTDASRLLAQPFRQMSLSRPDLQNGIVRTDPCQADDPADQPAVRDKVL